MEELERQIQEDQAEHLRITREALECTRRHLESRLQSAPYLISIGISTVAQEEVRLTQDMQRLQSLQSDLDDLERRYRAPRAREGRPMGNFAQSDVPRDRIRARASQPRALNATTAGRRSPTPPPPYKEARTPPPTYEEAIASGTYRTITVNADRTQQQLATAATHTRMQASRFATVNYPPRPISPHYANRLSGRLPAILLTENQQNRTILGRVAGEDEQTSYRERGFPTHGRRHDARHDSMGNRDRSKSPRSRHNPGRSSVGATSNRSALLDNDSSRTRESSSYLQTNSVVGGPRGHRDSAQQASQAQQPAARPSSLPMMGPYAVTEDYATLHNSSNGTPFRRDQRQVLDARLNRTPAQAQVNFAGNTDGDLPMGDAYDGDLGAISPTCRERE